MDRLLQERAELQNYLEDLYEFVQPIRIDSDYMIECAGSVEAYEAELEKGRQEIPLAEKDLANIEKSIESLEMLLPNFV